MVSKSEARCSGVHYIPFEFAAADAGGGRLSPKELSNRPTLSNWHAPCGRLHYRLPGLTRPYRRYGFSIRSLMGHRVVLADGTPRLVVVVHTGITDTGD